MRQLAAHAPIILETTVLRGDLERLRFEIVDERGQLLAASEDLALSTASARWIWTPNGEDDELLSDGLDERVVEARVRATHRAAARATLTALGRIRVFRDVVDVRVVDEAGAAVEGARVRLLVDPSGARTELAGAATDADGLVRFAGLPAWRELAARVRSPWAPATPERPWTAGKDRGRTRELTVVPRRYDAALLELRANPGAPFTALPSGDLERRQYVNCEGFRADEDVLRPGEDPSCFGRSLELRVGARAREAASLAGERIYLELQSDDPAARLRGADSHGVLALELGPRGATCTVELGPRAGSRVSLGVSHDGSFGAATDQRLELVTWHRHYYELAYPERMSSDLDPAPELRARGHDLPAATREVIASELDPEHVELRLARAHRVDEREARARGRLVDAAFFGRSERRELYLGSRGTPPLGPSFDPRARPRTLFIELLDLVFAPEPTRVTQTIELQRASLELGPCEAERCFVPDPRGLGVAPSPPPTWTAPPPQPSARPRGGTLAPDSLTLASSSCARLRLPDATAEDPGAWVDASSPVRVQLTLVEFYPAEPSGAQLVLDADPERVAEQLLARLRAHRGEAP